MPIKIHCFTNIDEFKHEYWPETLPAVPSIGHSIASRSSRRLKIVALSWWYDGTLEIELHRGAP